MRPPPRCGTRAGYQRHRKHGEPVDDACRDAYNAYYRDYYAAMPTCVRLRYAALDAARRQARARLSHAHPARFAALVAELLPAKGRHALAKSAARTRLANEHPEQYARLLAEERAERGLT